MKSIKITLGLSLSLVSLVFFSSCESSKVAFGNSYYFKQTPKKVNQTNEALTSQEITSTNDDKPIEIENPLEKEAKVYASAEAIVAKQSIKEKIESVENRIEKVKALNELETKIEESQSALSKEEKRELRKEQRQEKRELKKEIKALAKEYKKAPEEVKQQMAVSGNTRTGIIIGAVGLILLIIGGAVLYPIGAILLVVGLVLILIDVL
ncbi:septum formation inhibitor MinC [Catalinimonas alkaloidigena]|uniref:hypothetical protein n=1 Tax=Catalinimonas alkaloidigena TaxID=1075417 RepID=UPI002404C729|nr:hypothetical protein [Catalinimonas alkaloidigena]MDF9797547.1 septum formation inhibitor MinC [Catalinimonas alkaloidigena]